MPPKRLGKHAPPPPDDSRCRRSDGKQWRCPEPVLEGFALCKYHHRRSYQHVSNPNPNPSPSGSASPSPDPPPAKSVVVVDEQKPWKLRIKKPNSAPEARRPIPPPPSPSSSDEEDEETENGSPKILPTVLALEHSKSGGGKRRGRKPNPHKHTPVPMPKAEIDDENNNNNITPNTNITPNNNISNNNNNVSGAQRCKRSDGRGWQCKARALPGEHYCDHHYKKIKLQQDAKLSRTKSGGSKKRRRSADVAVAMAKRRRGSLTSPMMSAGELGSGEERRELPKGLMTISPSAGGGVREDLGGERKLGFADEVVPLAAVRPLRSKNPQPTPVGPVKRLPLGGKAGRKSNNSSNNNNNHKACHRCGEAKAGPVVRCRNCMKRYFCSNCIPIWYGGMSKLEINTMCPVCRNCCTCDICTRLNPNINNNAPNNNNANNHNHDMIIDVPIREAGKGESKIINIKYASYPFAQLLTVIKKLSVEQLDELEIEAKKQGKRVSGTLVQVLEKGRDEQLNCNLCEGSITNLSMNCSNCNYKLCLNCSHKIRKEEKFQNPKFQNSFINCKSDSCESFHTCEISCPRKEGKLGLMYSFPIGWSETLIIGQENKSGLAACNKTNGHLNNENIQTAPSGFL